MQTINSVNTNEILDVPQPVSAQIKYIGGITIKESREHEPFSDVSIDTQADSDQMAACRT